MKSVEKLELKDSLDNAIRQVIEDFMDRGSGRNYKLSDITSEIEIQLQLAVEDAIKEWKL